MPVDDPEQLSETELSLLLANHLYGKLATTNRYLINKSRADKCKNGCPCDQRNCELTGMFGDTSLGKLFNFLIFVQSIFNTVHRFILPHFFYFEALYSCTRFCFILNLTRHSCVILVDNGRYRYSFL